MSSMMPRLVARLLFGIPFFVPFSAQSQDAWHIQYEKQAISLRGLSAVDSNICWASGSKGTVLLTTDAGNSWTDVSPPDCESLDFRDIEAFDSKSAVIASAGDVDRIYRTVDGGRTWILAYEHPNGEAFFDGMAFWNPDHGILMGDPIDDRIFLLETCDGGDSWQPIQVDQPRPGPGEAGFAASGTNLCVAGDRQVWIALGSAMQDASFETSHIWYSSNCGRDWQVLDVPFRRDQAAGIFSIAHLDSGGIVAVGGKYTETEVNLHNAVRSPDGGRSWMEVISPPTGYRSSVTQFPRSRGCLLICVGPNGTDLSRDGGCTWERVSEMGFHAVSVAHDGTCWAAGSEGRIAKRR